MSGRLINNLKRRAVAWAGQLTSLAKSYAPHHVQPAISSHVEDGQDGQYIIRITADRYKPLDPRNTIPNDARAQEFGSGLRARRGAKNKYLIRGKPWLAFYGTNGFGNAFGAFNPTTRQGVGEKTIVLTHEVHHPGIQAANEGQGYIAPAMKELRKRAKAELSKEIRDAIVGDLRESFGRKSG